MGHYQASRSAIAKRNARAFVHALAAAPSLRAPSVDDPSPGARPRPRSRVREVSIVRARRDRVRGRGLVASSSTPRRGGASGRSSRRAPLAEFLPGELGVLLPLGGGGGLGHLGRRSLSRGFGRVRGAGGRFFDGRWRRRLLFLRAVAAHVVVWRSRRTLQGSQPGEIEFKSWTRAASQRRPLTGAFSRDLRDLRARRRPLSTPRCFSRSRRSWCSWAPRPRGDARRSGHRVLDVVCVARVRARSPLGPEADLVTHLPG